MPAATPSGSPTPPSPPVGSRPGRLGSLLVALQFSLLGALGIFGLIGTKAALAHAASALPIDALLLAALAMLLGLWALASNRPGNFHIRPLPKADGELVQHGPYRWIRHPMYSAVLLLGASLARSAGLADQNAAAVAASGMPTGRLTALLPSLSLSAWAWWCWAALLAVLVVKAGVEEAALRRHHSGYADYCRRSRRFLPGLW
ncbi:MAG: hypothetical protein RL722_2894 [Pseudomonadota bacterium]|jgi:protein-S-isoprenylcysteine O-methyltransferase Ste14